MLSRITAYVRRHHLALLALFFALGGTAIAAGGKLLPKNSVGTAQVVNGSLQKVDLSAAARRVLKGNRGAAGARGATGAAGSVGPAGAQGAPGVSATKLFAHVKADGTLSSVAKGATSAARNSEGSYTVAFNQSLQGCVALAQVGFVLGVAGSFTNDTLAQTAVHASDVLVTLFRTSTGTAIDGSFNLVVFC
jgi:hypothetical protein